LNHVEAEEPSGRLFCVVGVPGHTRVSPREWECGLQDWQTYEELESFGSHAGQREYPHGVQ